MASRICSQCGQEAPRTAKFCSQCSASLTGEPTIPRAPLSVEQTRMDAAASKSKTVLITVLAVAVVVLLAVAGYAFSKYTSVVNDRSVPLTAPPVVQAAPPPAPAAAPVTQAPTPDTTAPPVTQAPQPAAVVAPPEVVSYLAFIQQMEQERVNLDNAQVAAILPLLGTAQSLKTDDESDKNNGTTQINQAMSANLAKWQALIKQFQAQSPPDECSDLANSYYKLLEDYTDLSSQIQVALENGDTAKVMSLQGAQGIVDQDATAADSALSDVCTKYNAKKLFAITADGSGETSAPVTGV